MKESWLLENNFRQEFLDFCKLASEQDDVFKVFKNNDRIKTIIENTNQEWSDKAIRIMNEEDSYIEKLAIERTPTFVRYLYTIFLINKIFKIEVYSNRSIVEIGGGYGGMRMACDLIHEYNILSYKIYDLPEVKQLQKRYLRQYSLEEDTEFANGIEESEPHDLLISWCAWSELDKATKEEYAEKVISKAKHFFICSNYNLPEDKEILSKYFSDINEYSDELVMGVLWK